jgi:signal transduction histidine kinase
MFMPLLIHLGLSYPATPQGTDRAIIRVGYATGGLFAVLMLIGYDPFLDLTCWRTCATGVWAPIASTSLTEAVIVIGPWVTILLAGALSWRLLIRGVRRDSRLTPMSVAVAGLALLAVSASILTLRGANPPFGPHPTLYAASGWLLILIGGGVAWDLATLVMRRRALAALTVDLEKGTGDTLPAILRRTLHDETVEVQYWIPRLERYVDLEGHSAEPELPPGVAVATIERAGDELGRVLHRSTVSVAELEREIGAAAKLAVDNDRLRAELRAQAIEIKASQERIVLEADATRRRIERDLHDGAQQRLVTLSYQLRLARTEAETAGDHNSANRLTLATDVLLATIDEVRTIAHGIFPSILADAGLTRALEALREDTGFPQKLDVRGSGPPAVDMAAYQLVVSVIDSLPEDDRIVLTVETEQVDQRLDVDIEVDGHPLAEIPTHASDRIGALGGTIGYMASGMWVKIPCG